MTGKQLLFKRQLIGLSAEELAKRVGVSRQTINNIERGVGHSVPVMRVIEYELGKAFIEWDLKTININL